jgi:hypothetical protein
MFRPCELIPKQHLPSRRFELVLSSSGLLPEVASISRNRIISDVPLPVKVQYSLHTGTDIRMHSLSYREGRVYRSRVTITPFLCGMHDYVCARACARVVVCAMCAVCCVRLDTR